MLYINEPKASLYTGLIHKVGGYELYIPRVIIIGNARYYVFVSTINNTIKIIDKLIRLKYNVSG